MKNLFRISLFVFTLPLVLAGGDRDAPTHFLEVSTDIYRSGRPTRNNLEWLKEVKKIKTIINLENDDDVVEREEEWARDLGITYESIPMSAFKTPRDRDVNRALDLLADPDTHPILVHCKHGRDRTGMIIGLHRVENENVDAEEAYDEMLDLGFRPMFYKLDNYYKERTGLEDNAPMELGLRALVPSAVSP